MTFTCWHVISRMLSITTVYEMHNDGSSLNLPPSASLGQQLLLGPAIKADERDIPSILFPEDIDPGRICLHRWKFYSCVVVLDLLRQSDVGMVV